MNSTFEIEYELIEKELKKSGIIVLATSTNDKVTARSMCTLYHQGFIYFQTSSHLEKYKQIKANSNVALTTGYIQIEGKASIIGRWEDHPELCKEYCKKHLKSYDTYKHLPTQEVVKVKIERVKNWRYLDGVPYMIDLSMKNNQLRITKEV